MKRKLAVLALLLITLSSLSLAREKGSQGRTEQSIAGVWKGRFDNSPAIDVTLKVEGGKLAGTAVFYFVQNTDSGPVVKGTDELPLLEPAFDGTTLSFKVKRKDGSIFGAKIKFVAENRAVLKPEDESSAPDENDIYLTREK